MADLVEIPAVEPDDDAIDVLESVIAKIRAGKISSVAVAVVYRDGTTGDAWSKTSVMGTLIGAVAVLQSRLISRITRKDAQ